MTLHFQGLSGDKTKLIFEDMPTVDRDTDALNPVLSMLPQNVVGMLGIWAKTCHEITELKETAKPALPLRQTDETRINHSAICKTYRQQCDTIELNNSGIHERKGVEYIDKLISGFALYEGLCDYAVHNPGYEIPDTAGIEYFRQELQIAKIDRDASPSAAPERIARLHKPSAPVPF